MKDTATISTEEYYALKNFKERIEAGAILFNYDVYDSWYNNSGNLDQAFQFIDKDEVVEALEKTVKSYKKDYSSVYNKLQKLKSERKSVKDTIKSMSWFEIIKTKW